MVTKTTMTDARSFVARRRSSSDRARSSLTAGCTRVDLPGGRDQGHARVGTSSRSAGARSALGSARRQCGLQSPRGLTTDAVHRSRTSQPPPAMTSMPTAPFEGPPSHRPPAGYMPRSPSKQRRRAERARGARGWGPRTRTRERFAPASAPVAVSRGAAELRAECVGERAGVAMSSSMPRALHDAAVPRPAGNGSDVGAQDLRSVRRCRGLRPCSDVACSLVSPRLR